MPTNKYITKKDKLKGIHWYSTRPHTIELAIFLCIVPSNAFLWYP
jgi:hypothetical protein